MRSLRIAAVITMLSVAAPIGTSAQYAGLQPWAVGTGANNHWYPSTLAPSDWRVAESAALGAGG